VELGLGGVPTHGDAIAEHVYVHNGHKLWGAIGCVTSLLTLVDAQDAAEAVLYLCQATKDLFSMAKPTSGGNGTGGASSSGLGTPAVTLEPCSLGRLLPELLAFVGGCQEFATWVRIVRLARSRHWDWLEDGPRLQQSGLLQIERAVLIVLLHVLHGAYDPADSPTGARRGTKAYATLRKAAPCPPCASPNRAIAPLERLRSNLPPFEALVRFAEEMAVDQPFMLLQEVQTPLLGFFASLSTAQRVNRRQPSVGELQLLFEAVMWLPNGISYGSMQKGVSDLVSGEACPAFRAVMAA